MQGLTWSLCYPASVRPRSPIARSLLSLVFVLHFVLVVAYVYPYPHDIRGLNKLSQEIIPRMMLRQKWNMFRKPNTWDKLLVHQGILADGSVVELMPTNAAPEGSFLRVGYDRMTKAHNVVAFEKEPKHFTPDYADWLCREADPQVVSVVLIKRAIKHRTRAQWAMDPPAPMRVKDQVVWEQPCMR